MSSLPNLRRTLLAIVGVGMLAYSLAVFVYVQVIPDLGIRTYFSTQLRAWPNRSESAIESAKNHKPFDRHLKLTLDQIGPIPVEGRWSRIIQAPRKIAELVADYRKQEKHEKKPDWLTKVDAENDHAWIRVVYEDKDGNHIEDECLLSPLPLGEQLPSLLWFLLKASLLLIGAWVWWRKPDLPAAEQFYIMCLVTVGAFIGGFHFYHLTRQPVLLVVFIICAVLLPAVSLHFYSIFPRPRPWIQRAPRLTLAIIYIVPTAFLVAIMVLYLRLFLHSIIYGAPMTAEEERHWLEQLKVVILVYMSIAAVWYLGSVTSLVHSYLTVPDATERNQVRSILFGAVLALVPIGYSLYVILQEPAIFEAGGTTWPMFTASALLTIAYAVSITRYKLMEVEKLVSSSVDYFIASFLAAALYYLVVFVSMLIFKRATDPGLVEALTVSCTVILLLFVLDQARARFRKFLDRRFTKQKTQLDQTLQRMGQAVEQLVDPLALAQKFLHATTDLLGVAQGSVFLRQGDPPIYRLAGCQGTPPPLGELPPGSPLVDALMEGKVISGAPKPYPPMTSAQKQLQLLGGQLAHPITQDDQLLAFVVLGPKDPPYRPEDAELLGAFGQIIGLALESAEGHRTIDLLNQELRDKVEKISEQQRRILSLQSQLHRQRAEPAAALASGAEDEAAIPDSPAGIIGKSAELRRLLGLVRKVASTDAAVLIRGESGTGKELLARAVHETSVRAAKPYVKVHCAALSANLLESELFGHVKGAFTGAHKDKVGRFELAHGGTLFLDEIGDIGLEVQTKLLRVIQERTIERVGSAESIPVDVRIVTATHQNLEGLIRQGRFREDLFYRLNVFPIAVPPLRDRVDDIAELARFFTRQAAQRCKKEIARIDDDVLDLLQSYSWPGNIRQLQNVIERAVVIADGNTLTLADLPAELDASAAGEPDDEELATAPVGDDGGFAEIERPISPFRRERLRQERTELVRALASANGNKAEAARALGMARSTLVSRLKKFGLL
jgi:transcriptional regulator with GAF, ATPase, and Fis domain